MNSPRWCNDWGVCAGSSTLTAFGLAAEIGDWHRLTGRSIGAYLGLVPLGVLLGRPGCRAGSPRPAMAMFAATAGRSGLASPSPVSTRTRLRRRWDAGTPAARARGQAGNQRLHHRWASFDKRKKRPVVANAAIARELAGWCWSLAVLDD